MGRPSKKGLDYFPLDVNLFSDGKIEDLMGKYSSDGLTIYLAILCIVYRNGYYFEAENETSIVNAIHREIYNERISRQRVREVLHFCGVIRLLDSRLLCANVITSASIQSRYKEVTVRNKVDKSKYWLLSESEKEDRALESVPSDDVSATETGVNVAETEVSATETATNKSKEKEITTTTYIAPTFHEIYEYFKHEAYFSCTVSFVSEANKFSAYNANRGWDCLPDWKAAADLWAARCEERE